MSTTARISSPLGYLAMAALATIVTGCASTPPPSAAGAPASAAELLKLSNFTKKAQDEGWTPVVHHGQVLYCVNQASLGSHLPTATCLDKSGLQRWMLAEERQRQRLALPLATQCLPGFSCTKGP